MSKIFNLATTPLDPGVTLIEASAGTGKTFSLAGLILRLVAEEHIPIKQILAVTFTIAATAELKERVRGRLREASQKLREGKSDDELIARILARTDLARSMRSIDLALQSFDEAQVFTIHGFCHRVLQDYAFESGISFDAELVIDGTPLFQEVARDFWRLRLSAASPLIAAIFLAWEKSPNEWAARLDGIRNHPDVVFIPPAGKKSFDELATKIQAVMKEIRGEWKKNQSKIKHILQHDRHLSRAQNKFRLDRVADLLAKIAEACGDFDCADPLCLKSLKDVSVEAIETGTLNNHPPPAHRFFELCTRFVESVEALFLQLTYDFLQYAETEIPTRKAQTNTVTFDDLILRLRSALKAKIGERLVNAVGASYRAVLVDEFQDTDPAQYQIFRQIFGGGEHRLYYVGDPKQAIYGFRGADVFTYLAAALDADRTLTLGTNWRSEQKLVNGVNALFQQTKHPFILPGISYHDIQPAPEPNLPLLTNLPKAAIAPLSFRTVKSMRATGEPMNKAEATSQVCEAVAADMKRLQASGARLGDQAIRFEDMSVLVRTHAQAEQIQEVFRRHGIRSIVQSGRSVFASKEAADLQLFLEGLIDPVRERLFKAALITTIVGLTGDDLVGLEADEAARQRWLDKFFQWRSHWASECFIAAFRQIVVDQNIRARLVRLPGGERGLTNFLHLAELLHSAETVERLKPDALVSWLRKQRNSSRVAQDEFQLRLESDSDAVQIVTVHTAKGLQYPIVFCPFLWTSADSDWWDDLQFHDRNNHNVLTLSLRGKAAGSDEQKRWATEETTSEEVRMLYVAITRAKNRCTIHVPDYQEISKSSLALLFKEDERGDLPKALTRLAQQARDCISLSKVKKGASIDQAVAASAPTLSPRPFTGRIDRTAMIASFSGLNTGRIEIEEQEPEITDEAEVVPEERPATGDTIFDFARGARAGDFFHAVLERVDFTQPQLDSLVDDQLLWHGFAGNKCRDAIVTTLGRLLEVELTPGVSLKRVPPSARISELEFTYRLKRLDPPSLAQLFGRCTDLPTPFMANLERLRFDPVEGYLRGFIDLFFEFGGRYFILDWKSNWLGNRPSDYGECEMRDSMAEHNYFLQAHLYVLAADLFLRSRLKEYDYARDFGGVFYVFVRGVDPLNPSLGILRQRPTVETILALRELAA